MTTPALFIDNLHKRFGGLPATRDVTMRVAQGERRLVIGPNGAGKTTLFNQITGDIAPTSGAIYLFGADVTRLSPAQRAHRGIARTYQIITLFQKDTLEHNVMLALLGLSRRRFDILRPLSRFPDMRAAAREALALVGLDGAADRTVSALAYGEKRRLEIALALAQKPKLLLLDEPMAGLSLEERKSVKSLIASIPRTTTLVMIEHDMDTALDLADAVTLLHYGKVLVDGSPQAVISDPQTREVYLGV
ncbi:MAG: ABC transporter ATP-binding protein [Hyphomicrobiales bacterium]|nr:ABC transporter ATP-binding protein [Hyphomicrobiales bacterium]